MIYELAIIGSRSDHVYHYRHKRSGEEPVTKAITDICELEILRFK